MSVKVLSPIEAEETVSVDFAMMLSGTNKPLATDHSHRGFVRLLGADISDLLGKDSLV